MIWIIQFSSNSNEIVKYYSTSSIYQPFEFILKGMVYQKTPIFFTAYAIAAWLKNW